MLLLIEAKFPKPILIINSEESSMTDKLPVKDWYFIIVCAGSLITNGLVPGSSHHIPWAHTHTAPHPTKQNKKAKI